MFGGDDRRNIPQFRFGDTILGANGVCGRIPVVDGES